MTKIITVSEARARFAEITDDVAFKGNTYLLVKNGKEVAQIVPSHKEGAAKSVQIAEQGSDEKDLKNWLDAFAHDFKEDLEELAKS